MWKRATVVGSYPPNAWGLYDMHGNAAEWCADWYAADYYAVSPAIDPAGPRAGAKRVVRGGGYFSSPEDCGSGRRRDVEPDARKPGLGFRVVALEGVTEPKEQ